jgi:hypothetical protein
MNLDKVFESIMNELDESEDRDREYTKQIFKDDTEIPLMELGFEIKKMEKGKTVNWKELGISTIKQKDDWLNKHYEKDFNAIIERKAEAKLRKHMRSIEKERKNKCNIISRYLLICIETDRKPEIEL